jgi:hypothetical protein
MEKGPYYCKNLTSRILKSFSDRVTKQLGWNEVRGFSINIHSMKTMNSGKLAVVGTFKVSSAAPVTFKYPKLYSNATIRWSGEKLGTEAGLTEKTLQTKSANFIFEI